MQKEYIKQVLFKKSDNASSDGIQNFSCRGCSSVDAALNNEK